MDISFSEKKYLLFCPCEEITWLFGLNKVNWATEEKLQREILIRKETNGLNLTP